jgi:hypothetical protein
MLARPADSLDRHVKIVSKFRGSRSIRSSTCYNVHAPFDAVPTSKIQTSYNGYAYRARVNSVLVSLAEGGDSGSCSQEPGVVQYCFM